MLSWFTSFLQPSDRLFFFFCLSLLQITSGFEDVHVTFSNHERLRISFCQNLCILDHLLDVLLLFFAHSIISFLCTAVVTSVAG
nr:MAG TPA: hypothetical protein [Caudoviricetes sp.]